MAIKSPENQLQITRSNFDAHKFFWSLLGVRMLHILEYLFLFLIHRPCKWNWHFKAVSIYKWINYLCTSLLPFSKDRRKGEKKHWAGSSKAWCKHVFFSSPFYIAQYLFTYINCLTTPNVDLHALYTICVHNLYITILI